MISKSPIASKLHLLMKQSHFPVLSQWNPLWWGVDLWSYRRGAECHHIITSANDGVSTTNLDESVLLGNKGQQLFGICFQIWRFDCKGLIIEGYNHKSNNTIRRSLSECSTLVPSVNTRAQQGFVSDLISAQSVVFSEFVMLDNTHDIRPAIYNSSVTSQIWRNRKSSPETPSLQDSKIHNFHTFHVSCVPHLLLDSAISLKYPTVVFSQKMAESNCGRFPHNCLDWGCRFLTNRKRTETNILTIRSDMIHINYTYT